MRVAARDENSVPSLLGADSNNGIIPVAVEADPSTHRLFVSDGTTGTDHGPMNAPRDVNFVPVLMGISRTDGVTPVVVYARASTGSLLVDSH